MDVFVHVIMYEAVKFTYQVSDKTDTCSTYFLTHTYIIYI